MTFLPKVLLHIKLPTRFNSLKRIPEEFFIELEEKFLHEYNGYTRIVPPEKGAWVDKTDGKQYHDWSITYEIFIERKNFMENVEGKLSALIDDLKSKFKQKAIACYYHEIIASDF